jgi:multidrug efflux system membrane fusion protein
MPTKSSNLGKIMTSATDKAGLFERKPYLLAILITIALVFWMASGDSNSEELSQESTEQEKELLPKVQVEKIASQDIKRSVDLYGRTEPERSLELSSEVEGQVAKIHFDEGQFVKAGQVVLELKMDDEKEQLAYAEALLRQREIEFQGAKSLADKGLQGESLLAQAKSALVAAQASLKQRRMTLSKLQIVAPFDGVLESRSIEVGSFVTKGKALFNLVDLDPLIVNANVTEKYIQAITDETEVLVKMVDGSEVAGSIRYVASVSNKGTNTFPIEINISNKGQKVRAGMSTELQLLFATEQAIKVSPALLALDAKGNLGVKTVENDAVVFKPIDLIKAEPDGVWLGGFDGITEVITRGQGFVRPGDKVQVSYQ